MIAKADIRRVQEWMGHADVQTTMRYLHYAPRADEAALVAEAFRIEAAAGDRERRLVPRISAFFGIVITMFCNEGHHPIPTSTREYGDHARVDRIDGRSSAGRFRPAPLRLVREWAALHHDELIANWERAREHDAARSDRTALLTSRPWHRDSAACARNRGHRDR